MFKFRNSQKIFTKIGFGILASLILGGIGLAVQTHNSTSKQNSKNHATKLPEVSQEIEMSDQSEKSKVEIKQETSRQTSPGGSVSSSSDSTVEHKDGTNNVSVTNQSSQSASSDDGSANTQNSTSTSINIQND